MAATFAIIGPTPKGSETTSKENDGSCRADRAPGGRWPPTPADTPGHCVTSPPSRLIPGNDRHHPSSQRPRSFDHQVEQCTRVPQRRPPGWARAGRSMVANIAKLSVGREDYYVREVAHNREEYLSGHGESPGRWLGRGAQALGQEGVASTEAFVRVFHGRHPETGELLGRPHGDHGVPAFDLVLRPTKSVSLLYGLGMRRSPPRCWTPTTRRPSRRSAIWRRTSAHDAAMVAANTSPATAWSRSGSTIARRGRATRCCTPM
jgi:TrwC relaxase